MLSGTPIPPGETVEEEIEYIGMSKKELADNTGIPLQDINDILSGAMPISHDIAVAFERALGIPVPLLVNLEARCQRTLAQKNEREKASTVV